MKLKSIAAILVAAIMVVSVPMVAMAEDIKVQINDGNVDTYATDGVISNNITVKGTNAVNINSKDVKIDGNVTEGNNGGISWTVINISGEGSGNVEVTGNVTNEGFGEGVYVKGKHTLNIGGSLTTNSIVDYAIDATNGATVTVGSVESNCVGIKAKGTGTTVNVTGLVKSAGTLYYSSGITASNGATVTAGSVEATKNGIVAEDDAIVVVAGDVYAKNIGVLVPEVTPPAVAMAFIQVNKPTIVVEGTVTSEGDTPVSLGSEEAAENLFIYEIKRADGQELGSGYNQLNYIIKTAGATDTIQLQGVKTSDSILGKTYDYANGGDVITVSVKQGYGISSPYATKNVDGTYTIIVPNGGGVTIEAIMEAIKKSGALFTAAPTSASSASAPLTTGTWTNVNGVWTYTNNGQKLINTTAWIQYTNAQGQVVVGKFCFDNNGNMITNAWKQTADGTWNYFGADGAMLVNTTTPDGYVVDANGNWVK